MHAIGTVIAYDTVSGSPRVGVIHTIHIKKDGPAYLVTENDTDGASDRHVYSDEIVQVYKPVGKAKRKAAARKDKAHAVAKAPEAKAPATKTNKKSKGKKASLEF